MAITSSNQSKRIGITGAQGLLGWHTRASIHARQCQAAYVGEAADIEMVAATRQTFENDGALQAFLSQCDGLIHYAGVNRAESDDALVAQNAEITSLLLDALQAVGQPMAIAYANSTHSEHDTPYGRAKQSVADRLAQWVAQNDGSTLFDAVLPHVFGEQARPYYNNVTATFCETLAQGNPLENINPDGRVELIHAGAVADRLIQAVQNREQGRDRLSGRSMAVTELAEKLTEFDRLYRGMLYPNLDDPFDAMLFNSYRQHLYPKGYFPNDLTMFSDARGRLFEAVKGYGGGQTFISTTKPGVIRGQHFHRHKVERFLVLSGKARIEMRRVLSDERYDFVVDGDYPQYVDMPTLWTHNITNIGHGDLVTLFWTNDIFDPTQPDTYADPV